MKTLLNNSRVDVQGRTNVAGGMTPVAMREKGAEVYLKN